MLYPYTSATQFGWLLDGKYIVNGVYSTARTPWALRVVLAMDR